MASQAAQDLSPLSSVVDRRRGVARPLSGSRVALMVLGGLCLLIGLDAAVLRLDVWAPVRSEQVADQHGLVMTLGFMGTLISLERAQALRRAWAYLAPGLLGAGGIALAVAPGGPTLGLLLLMQGTWWFVAVMVAHWRRAPHDLVAVGGLGALMAALAATVSLAAPVSVVLPLLVAFLVVTIAAERAELAALTLGPRATPRLVALTVGLSTGSVVSLSAPAVGGRVLGICIVAVAAWLARDDVARRLVRTDGARRFGGGALLAGYVWLAVAGATWALSGGPSTGPAYDIAIHGVFLGFGLSMILAHAPTIFPAVLGRPVPYHPLMWVPLGLLHFGMAGRVLGDLLGAESPWRVGSLVTVLAAALLPITIVTRVLTSRS